MKIILKYLGVLILITFILTSCRMSTNELTEEVKISMQETWKKEDVIGIKINNLTLTHKGGNEYSGILEIERNSVNFKFIVEVIYDGVNIQWKIIE